MFSFSAHFNISLQSCPSHKLVNVYLMASYAYYHLHESPMTDEEFDLLCYLLIERYDQITHQHKHLLDMEALKAGTGFHISEYPMMVKHAASMWLQKLYMEQNLIDSKRGSL